MSDTFDMEHDGYVFKISKEAVVNNDKVYGNYTDKNGKTQKILKKSMYGQIVRLRLIKAFECIETMTQVNAGLKH